MRGSRYADSPLPALASNCSQSGHQMEYKKVFRNISTMPECHSVKNPSWGTLSYLFLIAIYNFDPEFDCQYLVEEQKKQKKIKKPGVQCCLRWKEGSFWGAREMWSFLTISWGELAYGCCERWKRGSKVRLHSKMCRHICWDYFEEKWREWWGLKWFIAI